MYRKNTNMSHIPNNIPNCDICITNIKNIVLIPCGHSLCKTCFEDYVNNYNYKKCHMCRCTIIKNYDIFY